MIYLISIRTGGSLETTLFGYDASTGIKNFVKEFLTNYFIQIDQESLKRKLNAMKCYKTEIAKYPFSRSLANIKNLAMYRGAQSGNYFAEAFKIIRLIKKIR